MKFAANVDPKTDTERVLERAKYIDSLGSDGILMQDHAYLGNFAETTTLLTAIKPTLAGMPHFTLHTFIMVISINNGKNTHPKYASLLAKSASSTVFEMDSAK